jgi:glyoxylase-like metal-dependent hydrolase (beta-lactamase superfamily II)
MLKEFGMKTKAHEGDRFLLDGVKDQAAMFGLSMSDEEILVDCFLKEREPVTFGNASLQVIHVPGHSPGSVVFYSEADKCLFAGDVLFRGSIGRTDLPGGNYEELISGIREKLFTLPDDTVVYSGHGPSTTIGREKKYNPFFPPARNT